MKGFVIEENDICDSWIQNISFVDEEWGTEIFSKLVYYIKHIEY